MCWIWITLLCLCAGCDSFRESSTVSYQWQTINSRDSGQPLEREPLYRVKVPTHWIRHNPASTESITDTTKPLCEFYLEEEEQYFHLTVHNFPNQRIPPMAQVSRWRQQFQDLDSTQTFISNVSHSGFVGVLLEAEGILKGKPTQLLAWSMQLAPEYTQKLDHTQKKADYTIKVVGAPDLIHQQKEAILLFANSFELIDELPSP